MPKYQQSSTEGPYNHAWLTASVEDVTAPAQGEIDAMLEIVSESGDGHGGHGGGVMEQREPADNNATDEGMGDMPGMNH